MNFIKKYEDFNRINESKESLNLIDKIQRLPELSDDIYDILADVESLIKSDDADYQELEKKYDKLYSQHDDLMKASDECEENSKKKGREFDGIEIDLATTKKMLEIYEDPVKAFNNPSKKEDREIIIGMLAEYLSLLEEYPLEVGEAINNLRYNKGIFQRVINKELIDAIMSKGGNIIRRLE